MADFLTRLIAHSRGLVSEPGRVEPLIASMYAAPAQAMPLEEEVSETLRGAVPSAATRSHAEQLDVLVTTQTRQLPTSLPSRVVAQPSSAPASASTLTRAGAESETSASPHIASAFSDSKAGLDPLGVPANESATSPAAQTPMSRALAPQPLRPELITRAAPWTAAAATLTPPPLPVTKVTIGRVEVRALHTPATPPPRAAPLSPKLSLEDYLRARNGRRE